MQAPALLPASLDKQSLKDIGNKFNLYFYHFVPNQIHALARRCASSKEFKGNLHKIIVTQNFPNEAAELFNAVIVNNINVTSNLNKICKDFPILLLFIIWRTLYLMKCPI